MPLKWYEIIAIGCNLIIDIISFIISYIFTSISVPLKCYKIKAIDRNLIIDIVYDFFNISAIKIVQNHSNWL